MCPRIARPFLTSFLFLALAIPLPAVTVDIAAGEQDLTILGAAAGDQAGAFRGIAGGDLNGDDVEDVIVSTFLAAPSGRTNAGRVDVFFGPFASGTTLDVNTSPDVTFWGARAGERLGTGIAIGDFDFDGRDDLAMSAPQANISGRAGGEVYVFFGPLAASPPIDLLLAFIPVRIIGANTFDLLGTGLDAGDVGLDPVDDLVIGAHGGDGPDNLRTEAGEVHVVFGPFATGTVIDLASSVLFRRSVIHGVASNDRLGSCVRAGDVSGNAQLDVLAGAPMASGPSNRPFSGQIRGVFGPLPEGAIIDLAVTPADVSVFGRIPAGQFAQGGLLGTNIEIGDVSGDGKGDLCFSVPFADGPLDSRADAGEVDVLLGPVAGTKDLQFMSPDRRIYGRIAFGQLDLQVTPLRDVTGDHRSDLVVGAFQAPGPGNARPNAGEAYMFPGPISVTSWDMASAPAPFTIFGAESGDLLGSPVGAIETSGDCVADVVAVAASADGPANSRPQAGEIYAVFGGGATGGCCTGSACSVLTRCDCESIGGTYNGDGSACAPGFTCPTGRCCIANTCSVTTEGECDEMGGTWGGQGSTCGPSSCSTGACCLPGGDQCVQTTQPMCLRMNGSFKGYGTTCGQTSCFGGGN